jgi:hypothetical protein
MVKATVVSLSIVRSMLRASVAVNFMMFCSCVVGATCSCLMVIIGDNLHLSTSIYLSETALRLVLPMGFGVVG